MSIHRSLQKKGIWTLIVVLCFFCIGLADDCGLVANTQDTVKTEAYQTMLKTFLWANYSAVYPAEAIGKALDNLKVYCCAHPQLVSEKDKASCKNIDTKRKVPESPYLYDHLVDIGMRRLDAFPNDALRYGLAPDPTGKKRGDIITAAGESKDGVTAKSIMDDYPTYRSTKTLISANATNKELATLAQNYNNIDKVTLRDKYLSICVIIRNLYPALQKDTDIVIGSFQSKCQQVANNRVKQEDLLTRSLMIKKSTDLLLSTSKAYMQNYFVQQKLVEMTSIIDKVRSLFATMVQQAAPSKSCSQ